MAHHFKVETVAALNKDGSPSKTKKTYYIYDQTRRGKLLIAKASSAKERDSILRLRREQVVEMHLAKHPNDLAFRRKHGISV